MTEIRNHPERDLLANELHTRPFPVVSAPARAAFLALRPVDNAAARDRNEDRRHLIALLDAYGAAHPEAGATHFATRLGNHNLKWESHTEFVTYTLFADGPEDSPFDPAIFDYFPHNWLDAAPGVRIASALIRIERLEDSGTLIPKLTDWFVPESVATSNVLDEAAVIAGDFQIDPNGHMRMAIFARPETGDGRIGRIVQRLCEIEIYKSMSMLGLRRARSMNARIGELDQDLTSLVEEMRSAPSSSEATLNALLDMSCELEALISQSSFRFGATFAYEALVNQRIEILRETRFQGRQSFAEFMMRRFDPAMRTVRSTERNLRQIAERAARAANMLRTRVDVERSAQNQKLLESMDRRADLQLRLQHTVEGLSVVAITYYGVNLVTYALGPFARSIGLDKLYLTAGATPLVLILVWYMVRRIRKSFH